MHIFGESRPAVTKAAFLGSLMALTLVLGACGGESGGDSSPSVSPAASTDTSATASPEVSPASLADLAGIEVSADTAAAPTINAPYPFTVSETLVRTVVEGSGAEVTGDNTLVSVQYAGINATTGEEFDSSWARGGQPVTFPLNGVVAGFSKAIKGQKVGSRIVTAITPADGYGPNGNSNAGIGGSDVLLFAIDIVDVQLSGPSGETVTPAEGLPVVTENNGVPTIATAGVPEPTSVVVQPLVKGSGTVVPQNASVRSKAVCVTWDGTEFYNDYASSGTDDNGKGTHAALWQALQGQQVGSRLLVTVPGDQAFPAGNPNPSIAPNSAMACVIDILYVQAAS
ncbi:hypothetical protein HMPREF1531_02563 [Propionibacterium sp. oral taxon 192 str. F0372]|uniref:FKBP-type peptidyl-prolyl cis-trans isomerase n=1 Tax=Propionibacterium sp. oral taxon 192 TaxID=671222 RepID=UPI000354185B|nr:FKBP-type peptidyl-prolyl cis-trans isomerase [Propionibacterium sp. oral taxon 192]EPH00451.1 hypothetical protein HMPREF1531_02563 [Propionibacterium sp. oral taxon 192 str. F0372]